MKLSKKEELLALGSALYLLGIEIEGSKSSIEALMRQTEDAGKESAAITQELLDNLETYHHANKEFTRLEQRYLELKKTL